MKFTAFLILLTVNCSICSVDISIFRKEAPTLDRSFCPLSTIPLQDGENELECSLQCRMEPDCKYFAYNRAYKPEEGNSCILLLEYDSGSTCDNDEIPESSLRAYFWNYVAPPVPVTEAPAAPPAPPAITEAPAAFNSDPTGQGDCEWPNQFDCIPAAGDRLCYAQSQKCDGRSDCPTGWDEDDTICP